jgi:hypothetical protein
MRDLDDYDLIIEGAWVRICCRLWWSDTPGEMTKTLKEWSNILRKNLKKTSEILKILIEKKIADGQFVGNEKITIICRRMASEQKLKEIRKESGSLGGTQNLQLFIINQVMFMQFKTLKLEILKSGLQ